MRSWAIWVNLAENQECSCARDVKNVHQMMCLEFRDRMRFLGDYIKNNFYMVTDYLCLKEDEQGDVVARAKGSDTRNLWKRARWTYDGRVFLKEKQRLHLCKKIMSISSPKCYSDTMEWGRGRMSWRALGTELRVEGKREWSRWLFMNRHLKVLNQQE